MPTKTHWKKVVSDSPYLGEADFQPGEEKIGTILNINQAEVVKTAEGKQRMAVVHFKESGIKPLILNVAKGKAIAQVAGSPYMEDWPGTAIQMYIEHNIQAYGSIVNAVRVRPFKPQPPVEIKCERCGKPITAARGMGPDQVAAYTFKKYGAKLCGKCAAQAKQESEAAKSEAVKPVETEAQHG